jgi:hypothetical protein
MRCPRALSGAVLALWAASSGCSSLHELARSEYSTLPERRGVRVETREGLVYDFDYASFSADSLTGFRHRTDLEGPVDQTVSFSIALEDVDHLTTRRLDWYRTGLVGGSMLAAVVVAGLGVAAAKPNDPGGSSGGGKGGFNP